MAPNFKEAQTVEGLYCTSVPTHLFQFVKPVSSASFHLTLSQRVTNLIHPRFLFSLSSTALCLPDLVPHLSILFPLLFLVEIAIGERLRLSGPFPLQMLPNQMLFCFQRFDVLYSQLYFHQRELALYVFKTCSKNSLESVPFFIRKSTFHVYLFICFLTYLAKAIIKLNKTVRLHWFYILCMYIQ